jgi:hypothetical protein
VSKTYTSGPLNIKSGAWSVKTTCFTMAHQWPHSQQLVNGFYWFLGIAEQLCLVRDCDEVVRKRAQHLTVLCA